MKICLSIFLTLFILLGLLYLYTVWAFWEPSDFEKGSFAYSTKIPDDIKSFQLIGAVSEPKYRFRIDDGVGHETIVIDYISQAPQNELIKYFESLDLQCKNGVCRGEYKNKMDLSIYFDKLKNASFQLRLIFLNSYKVY